MPAKKSKAKPKLVAKTKAAPRARQPQRKTLHLRLAIINRMFDKTWATASEAERIVIADRVLHAGVAMVMADQAPGVNPADAMVLAPTDPIKRLLGAIGLHANNTQVDPNYVIESLIAKLDPGASLILN